MTYVLQWVPPVCHSIIFPAPVWAVPTVFQHRIHSSCTGRVTLWAAVPPRWRNGHAGWVGPALSETAQMKVRIDVTSFRRIHLFIYIRTIDMPFLYILCMYVCMSVRKHLVSFSIKNRNIYIVMLLCSVYSSWFFSVFGLEHIIFVFCGEWRYSLLTESCDWLISQISVLQKK